MKMTYGDLKAGDVFEYEGQVYMKTAAVSPAANLENRSLSSFPSDCVVTASDFVLVHQSDLPSEPPKFLKGGHDNV